MRFDLTDLQLFVHILDSGTMTAAAQRTHMTLASASERVRGMEDQLGCALLQRQARGVRPTAAGHTLGQHARQVLAQMQQLRGAMGEFGAGLAGQIRLRGNSSAIREHLPLAISGFLLQHPQMALELQECSSSQVLEGLQLGQCDLGIAAWDEGDSAKLRGLHYQHWRDDPLVAVLPRQHALAARDSITLTEIANDHWVGLPRDSALQLLLQKQLQALLGPQALIRMRVQLPHFEGLCQLVEQQVGVSVMPAAAALRHAKAYQVAAVPLSEPWARRQLKLCYAAPASLTPGAAQLLAHLQQQAGPGDANTPGDMGTPGEGPNA